MTDSLWTKTGTNAQPVYARPDGVKIWRANGKPGMWVLVAANGRVVTRRERYTLGLCATPNLTWFASSLEQAKRGAQEILPYLEKGK